MSEIENSEKPEEMAAFFDTRADGYDAHMQGVVFTAGEFDQFYQAVSIPIEKTDQPVKILDIGCGTGLEIDALLQRVPQALITGLDVSEKMLELLEKKHQDHTHQITCKVASYLHESFGQQEFDYIISAMSLHHLMPETKQNLYEKIYQALKPGGKYIEGDSVTRREMENEFLAEYAKQTNRIPPAKNGYYHIDLPFSIDTQRKLLKSAGFKNFKVIWEKDHTAVWNAAVYVAET